MKDAPRASVPVKWEMPAWQLFHLFCWLFVSTYHGYLRVSFSHAKAQRAQRFLCCQLIARITQKILVIPVIRGDKKTPRRETVSSVKSRWLFISSVSRESTRICLHTESTEHTELRFVSLSLHADEDILWILWILCAILFSCLTRRRKGRKGFYQRDYTDYTVFYHSVGGTVSSEHQNVRTSIFALRRESVSSVKSRWIN